MQCAPNLIVLLIWLCWKKQSKSCCLSIQKNYICREKSIFSLDQDVCKNGRKMGNLWLFHNILNVQTIFWLYSRLLGSMHVFKLGKRILTAKVTGLMLFLRPVILNLLWIYRQELAGERKETAEYFILLLIHGKYPLYCSMSYGVGEWDENNLPTR